MVTAAGHTVAALAAVNAVGSPLVGDGPWFWAAPFEVGAEFGGRGWPEKFAPDATALRLKSRPQPSTTIGIVATDAALIEGAGEAARDHGA